MLASLAITSPRACSEGFSCALAVIASRKVKRTRGNIELEYRKKDEKRGTRNEKLFSSRLLLAFRTRPTHGLCRQEYVEASATVALAHGFYSVDDQIGKNLA